MSSHRDVLAIDGFANKMRSVTSSRRAPPQAKIIAFARLDADRKSVLAETIDLAALVGGESE